MLDPAYVLSGEPLRVIRWSYLGVSTESASYGLDHVSYHSITSCSEAGGDSLISYLRGQTDGKPSC